MYVLLYFNLAPFVYRRTHYTRYYSISLHSILCVSLGLEYTETKTLSITLLGSSLEDQ